MPLLLVEALSSLLFDGSDVDASRRSCVVISSLLMADASRCCDALGACRVQTTRLDESHSVAAQSWASI